MTQLDDVLSLSAALKVSPHTVRKWVREGKLRPTRLGRRLLFHPTDVTAFLDGARAGSPHATAGQKDPAIGSGHER